MVNMIVSTPACEKVTLGEISPSKLFGMPFDPKLHETSRPGTLVPVYSKI